MQKASKDHLRLINDLKPPPAKFLEVGCARGVLLDLARKNGYSVRGIELSTYASQYARDRFGLDVQTSTIEDAAFDHESFDVIVASDVIEHLRQPWVLIEKAVRLLEPNGILCIGTPNSHSLLYRIAEILGVVTRNRFYYPAYRFYGQRAEHLQIFNPDNLFKLTKNFDLKLVQVGTYSMPVSNMCDINFVYKLALKILSAWPYEMILFFKK